VWVYSIIYREHERSFLDAPPIANILQGKDLFDGVKELLATRIHSILRWMHGKVAHFRYMFHSIGVHKKFVKEHGYYLS
jgi:hypothetical protein